MKIYISINGVLRNLIDRIDYIYNTYYIDTEAEMDESDNFLYDIIYPIKNDDLKKYFKFHTREEFEQFLYIDLALNIFGHANASYPQVFFDLNNFMYENKNFEFTLIDLDGFGKSIPSTLFFLSKYGCLCKNIKFIKSKEIKKEWKNCDIWITDDKNIIDLCPQNKNAIKFNTIYNDYFTHSKEINNLKEINKTWLTYSENNIISALKTSMKFVIPKSLKMKREKMKFK
jgi:hypothetical protein